MHTVRSPIKLCGVRKSAHASVKLTRVHPRDRYHDCSCDHFRIYNYDRDRDHKCYRNDCRYRYRDRNRNRACDPMMLIIIRLP